MRDDDCSRINAAAALTNNRSEYTSQLKAMAFSDQMREVACSGRMHAKPQQPMLAVARLEEHIAHDES